MKVDSCTEGQGHSCPRDFVKPMQLDMDENGSQGTPRRRLSGSRVSTKSKAPSPPVPLKGLDSAGLSQRHSVAGYPLMAMDQKENLLDEDLTLVVVLPGGVEKMTTVHGSKPMMDLLVMLCAKYHLNPSGHTIELVTTNRNHIKFKPNALIGTLEAERILLKPKGIDDKNKKPGHQMPEATVRLVINYKKTQKTILRVSPRVPLEDLLPAICEKCEFDQQSTVLLRDAQSEDPLDLTCTLNDFAIREVYARDSKAMYSADTPVSPTTPTTPTPLGYSDTIPRSKDKIQKEKENKGLFSLFRRSKKKSEQGRTASAPASPVFPNKPRPLSMSSISAHSSTFNCSTMQSDTPKKRRAPLPPMQGSQSCPSNLSHRQRPISASESETQMDGDQMAGLSRSSESSLKRTKRKAPPPPSSPGVLVQDEPSLDGACESPVEGV
uniref:Cordon-bleu ubiquitin-like domain-containing protein n=1 Tax=Esox lucius TaxID=8010 RepID=A0A3P8YWN2_ESOLU